MAKKDFTKYKNGSIFQTRDEYLSKDKFDKKEGGGHYRKIVKTGCNKNNSGIKVVKLQTDGGFKLRHSNMDSTYYAEEFDTDNNGKPINHSYKFKTTKDTIDIKDLNFMQRMVEERNKIIKRNYAINNKKKKTSKK